VSALSTGFDFRDGPGLFSDDSSGILLKVDGVFGNLVCEFDSDLLLVFRDGVCRSDDSESSMTVESPGAKPNTARRGGLSSRNEVSPKEEDALRMSLGSERAFLFRPDVEFPLAASLLATISAMLGTDFFLVLLFEFFVSTKLPSRTETSEPLLFMEISKLEVPSFFDLEAEALRVIRLSECQLVADEVMSALTWDVSDSGVTPLRLALIILRTFFLANWLSDTTESLSLSLAE